MNIQKDNLFDITTEDIPDIRKDYNAWLKAAEELHNTCWYIKMRCNNSATIPESLANEINSSINQLISIQHWFNSEVELDFIIGH